MLDGDRGSVTAIQQPEWGGGIRKGSEEGGAHLGTGFQAALGNLELLLVGGKFLLQVL